MSLLGFGDFGFPFFFFLFYQLSNLMLTTYAFPQKSFPSMSEDGLSVELTVVAPEQPSPVSVLDVSFYKDDLPPSPVKKLEDPFKGEVLGSVI